MCGTCGCSAPTEKHAAHAGHEETVAVLKNLLSANDRQAARNRERFDQHGILAINLMSAPGAGKTALIEATVDALAERYSMAVIEGDLETENDAERIRAHGVPALQITTGSACHLDAHMIHDALNDMDLESSDVIFIENVGNLVCPASFDLGQHLNVALVSVPEGDDKVEKYPVMFRAADLVVISKTDLLPLMPEFDSTRVTRAVRSLASGAPVVCASTRTAAGRQPWLTWLRRQLAMRLPQLYPRGAEQSRAVLSGE